MDCRGMVCIGMVCIGMVCSVVTGEGTVETVTTVTGDTATVEDTGDMAATTVAFGYKNTNKEDFYFCFSVHACLFIEDSVLTGHGNGGGEGGGIWTGGMCPGGSCGQGLSRGGCGCCAGCSVNTAGSCSPPNTWTRPRRPRDKKRVEFRLLDDLHTIWFTPR